MTTLCVAFVEWPEGLLLNQPQWSQLKKSIAAAHPDILVTNELPFGSWIAENSVFSENEARLSIRAHEQGLEGLMDLNLSAVISSRPVRNGKRLANEAFVLEKGTVRRLHRKQYFPNEPGWFETQWYAGDGSGFDVAEVLGVRVGVLLCTDAMFNEHARAYGKQKASLIVIPRATGANIPIRAGAIGNGLLAADGVWWDELIRHPSAIGLPDVPVLYVRTRKKSVA